MDFSYAGRHTIILIGAAIVYVIVTVVSCKGSQKRFEIIDL